MLRQSGVIYVQGALNSSWDLWFGFLLCFVFFLPWICSLALWSVNVWCSQHHRAEFRSLTAQGCDSSHKVFCVFLFCFFKIRYQLFYMMPPRLFLEESAANISCSPASGCLGLYRFSSLPLQSWLIPPTVVKSPNLFSCLLSKTLSVSSTMLITLLCNSSSFPVSFPKCRANWGTRDAQKFVFRRWRARHASWLLGETVCQLMSRCIPTP